MENYIAVLIALWTGVFIGFLLAVFFRGAQGKEKNPEVRVAPLGRKKFPA